MTTTKMEISLRLSKHQIELKQTQVLKQGLKQSRNRKPSEFQELKGSLKLKNVLQILTVPEIFIPYNQIWLIMWYLGSSVYRTIPPVFSWALFVYKFRITRGSYLFVKTKIFQMGIQNCFCNFIVSKREVISC